MFISILVINNAQGHGYNDRRQTEHNRETIFSAKFHRIFLC